MLSSPVSELDFGTLSHLPELSCTAPQAERLSAQSALVSEAITAALRFQDWPKQDQETHNLRLCERTSDVDDLQSFVFSFVLQGVS